MCISSSGMLSLCILAVLSDNVFLLTLLADSWQSRWVLSDWKKDDSTNGDWVLSAGKFHADAEDKGKVYPSAPKWSAGWLC